MSKNAYLSNGRVPYKCAALLTNQVAFKEITAREKNDTNKAIIGSSPKRTTGIAVGKSKAKIVYNNL